MHSIIRWILIAAVIAAGGLPIEARAFQKCIFIYAPVADPPPCQVIGGCAPGGCPGYGEFPYGVTNQEWFGCDDGVYRTNDCSNTPTATSWMQQSYPGRIATCNNPWFGSFDGCDSAPTPNQCRNTDPVNHKVNWLGDPVDLTNGALEQTPTDLNLGRGLQFTRHYASNAIPTLTPSPMGRDGGTASIGRFSTERSSRPGPTTRSRKSRSSGGRSERRCRFSGSRSLRPRHPVFRSRRGQGGAYGAGGLSGEAGSSLLYTDDDGTRVSFEPVRLNEPADLRVEAHPAGRARDHG